MRATLVVSGIAAMAMTVVAWAQQTQKSGNEEKAPVSSYMPVVETESFGGAQTHGGS